VGYTLLYTQGRHIGGVYPDIHPGRHIGGIYPVIHPGRHIWGRDIPPLYTQGGIYGRYTPGYASGCVTGGV